MPSLADGALHGIYWAGYVLSAIQRSQWMVRFPVLFMHAFSHQVSSLE